MINNKMVHTPAKAGSAYWFMGDLFTFLATGADTGGSCFSLKVIVAPGNGPPPHVHHQEDEQFFILEGMLTFLIGDQVIHAKAGDYIYIPRDVVHLFKNGSTTARLYATFTPAGIEGFFKEAGQPVIDRSGPPPVTPEAVERFLAIEASGWRDHHETIAQPMT